MIYNEATPYWEIYSIALIWCGVEICSFDSVVFEMLYNLYTNFMYNLTGRKVKQVASKVHIMQFLIITCT
jgi:hypothetical protein